MAYNQKPGSAIKQKTGNGIPSALLQMGGGTQYEPDYSFYNQREKESGRGVTSQAAQLLKDLPQGKKIKPGVIDARNSLNQVQMAQDSLAAVKGLTGQARIDAGKDWSDYSSINNPKSMASRRGSIDNRTGKPYPRDTYTGGGGNDVSGTFDKEGSAGNKKIKQKLLFELATSGYKTNAANSKDFNVEVDNPKSGAAKLKAAGYDTKGNKIKLAPKQMKPSSPVKQKQALGKEPKPSVPEKTAKQIKEDKMSREPAPKQMKPKGSAAKMKKC